MVLSGDCADRGPRRGHPPQDSSSPEQTDADQDTGCRVCATRLGSRVDRLCLGSAVGAEPVSLSRIHPCSLPALSTFRNKRVEIPRCNILNRFSASLTALICPSFKLHLKKTFEKSNWEKFRKKEEIKQKRENKKA